MLQPSDKHWIIGAVIGWAITVAAAIGAILYVRYHSAALLDHLVSGDPAPSRQALYCQLQADQLVQQALLLHEAATSGTTRSLTANGTLVPQTAPLLEQAEQLYLESLDAVTSQPALLFQLGEVNLLRGQRARGYLYLERYWEAMGETGLARAYHSRATAIDPSATIPLRRK